MKQALKWIPRILACIVAVFLLFWFQLPPINLFAKAFWSFLAECIIVCAVICGITSVLSFAKKARKDTVLTDGKTALKTAALPTKIVIGVLIAMLALSIVFSVIGARFFNAKRYANLLTTTDGNFSAEVAELTMSQIPVVDRDTATRLGQRKLGEISDLVSQFEIEDEYTQINYQNRPVRVTPLGYADIIKWFTNQNEGVPGYIKVDLTTQETELVRLKEGIRISRSEYFLRDLDRTLRFQYPTKIFKEVSFEIDEQGTPYWVASVVDYKIGFWSGEDICGVVLLNACSGESAYYDLADIPRWVDQAFDSDMIIQQLTDNGMYSGGFWNSVFGQKNVRQPTDGYNYIALNDDVWLYTGITSVTSDESNIGFVLINLRTKEARYYVQAGAEEYSAMESAQGQVQHLSYNSTFPILLNVADRPTYFMSLKDGAGLVKMYAFVDMEQYQVVGTGTSLEKAQEAYLQALENENINVDTPEDETPPQTETLRGTVKQISAAVVGGNTCYYVVLEGEDATVYTLPITLSDRLPFVTVGSTLELTLTDQAVTAVTVDPQA